MATRILYTSPSVEIRFQNDSYSIVALVLIEHVFSGNKIDMHALLFMDDDMRKALYPLCKYNVENIKFYGAFYCAFIVQSFAKSRARPRIELNLASRFRKAQEDTINTHVDHHLAKHGREIAGFQKEIRRFAAKNIQVKRV